MCLLGELEIKMGDVPHLEAEDEPLREIWRYLNLDIDQDLTMADLKLICDHIGLDMSQEVCHVFQDCKHGIRLFINFTLEPSTCSLSVLVTHNYLVT